MRPGLHEDSSACAGGVERDGEDAFFVAVAMGGYLDRRGARLRAGPGVGAVGPTSPQRSVTNCSQDASQGPDAHAGPGRLHRDTSPTFDHPAKDWSATAGHSILAGRTPNGNPILPGASIFV